MSQFIVSKQIDINAQPSLIWDALTNPKKTKEYFFNCEVFSDWTVGSPITFKGKVLLIKNIELNGHILAIVPGKLLKYDLTNHDGSSSTVTDTLEYHNGITTLSITDDVGNGEGAKERYEKSQKGWYKVLTGLKELVEEETKRPSRDE